MRIKLFTAIGLAVLVCGSLVIGHSTGPPEAVTGAPGETLCTDCHLGNTVNTPGGSLTITPSAMQYTPGETLGVVVNLSKTGQLRWGFELTALDGSGNSAGTLLDTSIYTQLLSGVNGRQYIEHTALGTYEGIAGVSPGWGFLWVAPPVDAGPVTLYAAGNAANDDQFNTGDFIYTATKVIQGPPPPLCCIGTTGNVDCDPGDNIDIGDLTLLVDNLFISFAPLCCPAEANIDGVGDVDIGDLTLLVDNLFISFTPLPNCP